MNLQQQLKQCGTQAQSASNKLSLLSTDEKNAALIKMANIIEQNQATILEANQKDINNAASKDYPSAFIDRLTLNVERIAAMVAGIKAIAQLPDPVGHVLKEWDVKSGLHIKRVSVPLGVILMIYESRPNVTADAAALCLKAGNAVILRGGSECVHSNRAIAACLQQALQAHNIDINAIQYVPTQDRDAVGVLLQMDEYIDVVIPRGGKSLIQRISENSKIPLFKHLEGICHTYVHADAELDMATNIILNAKLRRTGICGATETILIDKSIATKFLPHIIHALIEAGCEVRGDRVVQQSDKRVLPAKEDDWSTEYLDAIVSIKVVDGIDAAISHINHYGSHHTDAIVCQSDKVATQFLQGVNSAIVMHNCSTQFADGGEFGMGAEIGISTGKLHARGPVGVEQLTTFKYMVEGTGQVRPV